MSIRNVLQLGIVSCAVITLASCGMSQAQKDARHAGAAATLKAGVFPAQIQFQAGGYRDVDGDGVGEYAPDLKLMSGATDPKGPPIALMLLPEFFNAPAPQVKDQYRYSCVVGDDAERSFAVIAVPQSPESGDRAFAISQMGQVLYCETGSGEARFDSPDDAWSDKTYSKPAAGWHVLR